AWSCAIHDDGPGANEPSSLICFEPPTRPLAERVQVVQSTKHRQGRRLPSSRPGNACAGWESPNAAIRRSAGDDFLRRSALGLFGLLDAPSRCLFAPQCKVFGLRVSFGSRWLLRARCRRGSLLLLLALALLLLRLLALTFSKCLRATPRHCTSGLSKAADRGTSSIRRRTFRAAYAATTTFAACGPFSPSCGSYSTFAPSGSDLYPSPWIALQCTNKSFPPSARVMNP